MKRMVARAPTKGGDRVLLGVIAVGGMLGATARYGIAEVLPTQPGHFPWATLWVNAIGSLVLGFVLGLGPDRLPASRLFKPFVATGVIGAFTTMSTFLVDVSLLVKDDHAKTALLYCAMTLASGVALAATGMRAARHVSHTTPGTPR